MTLNNNDNKRISDPVAFVDAAIDLAVEEELENTEVTQADLRAASEIRSSLRPALAELRRRLVPTTTVIERAAPIRSELSPLDRGALISRIEQLRQRVDVRYSFQELKGLSDADLRQMLTMLLETTGG